MPLCQESGGRSGLPEYFSPGPSLRGMKERYNSLPKIFPVGKTLQATGGTVNGLAFCVLARPNQKLKTVAISFVEAMLQVPQREIAPPACNRSTIKLDCTTLATN